MSATYVAIGSSKKEGVRYEGAANGVCVGVTNEDGGRGSVEKYLLYNNKC